MAKRISLFSKEFADSEGNSPKNALVIELLAKHGVEGKTASSNISAEEEALIEGDLKPRAIRRVAKPLRLR